VNRVFPPPLAEARLPWSRLQPLLDRLRPMLTGTGDGSTMQRAAGGAFLIRIGGAAIAFLSQPLLARLMGSHEFGIYAYVWTWALLFGGMVDCGLAVAAQRFIPEYRGTGATALLRGFLSGSRWLATGVATVIAVVAALAISAFAGNFHQGVVIPMYIGCAMLPFWALCVTQDGIARSYGWIGVALLPLYIIRPIAIIALLYLAHLAGYPASAVTIMVAAVIATFGTTLWQTIVINRRLRGKVDAPARAYDFPLWISTSLPISISVAFFYLLSYVDVLVLELYWPPSDVAVYYAVQKLLALVAFVHFSMAAAVAHRFSEYRATGQGQKLTAFYATSRRWTFWPSLGGVVVLMLLGWPLLWLFGSEFVVGYPIIAILSVGMLARAAAGPAERLLTMVGRQSACALIYLAALLCNLLLCFILIPRFGLTGAAASTSVALILESVAMFTLTRRELAKAARDNVQLAAVEPVVGDA
jgi:O-antigen/teichoic acid export membrane protein